MAGRPPKRSRDDSLEAALRLFWERGFEATSLQELTQALGVGPSSIYNAFGSKADLFCASMTRYREREGQFLLRALEDIERSGIEVFSQMLREAPAQYTQPGRPCGCAILSGTASSSGNEEIDRWLREQRRQTREGLEARVIVAEQAGELGARSSASGVASFLLAMLQGISSQARDGASRAELEDLAETACVGLQALMAG